MKPKMVLLWHCSKNSLLEGKNKSYLIWKLHMKSDLWFCLYYQPSTQLHFLNTNILQMIIKVLWLTDLITKNYNLRVVFCLLTICLYWFSKPSLHYKAASCVLSFGTQNTCTFNTPVSQINIQQKFHSRGCTDQKCGMWFLESQEYYSYSNIL